MAILKSSDDEQKLRQSCLILASCLDQLKNQLRPGVSAQKLDTFAEKFIRDHGGIPSFMGYQGYKYSLCVSVDDEVVHGLPLESKIIPENGVVSLDLGVNFNGLFSDCAITIPIGEISDRTLKLIETTHKALFAGINVVKDGARVGDIGYVVDLEAKKSGFGNVLELGGHGVGYAVHEDPFIMHSGRSGKGPRLFENQVIAIEPMFTLGSGRVDFDDEDGWTVRTQDKSWAAHFEHTILVTKKGHEILTDISADQLLS